ncbi:hypothetical protein IWW45_006543 [Coemansia sp. RSA 485]|nr:hypothetical protein IWW45_006543 [Coemansia sp. RSA 485]
MTERADAREGGNQGQVQIRGQGSNAAAKETPIPWVKLSTALGVRLCEAANTVLILPFMYKMVSEYDIVKNPKDISFYAGLFLASISFCQTLFVVH